MAIIPINAIIRAIAQRVATDVGRRAAREFGDDLADLLGLEEGTSMEVARQRLRDAHRRGEISESRLRELHREFGTRNVTDFNQFMSIGLDQCGSDQDTFAALVEVWNREKDEIKNMSPEEVRRNLSCP